MLHKFILLHNLFLKIKVFKYNIFIENNTKKRMPRKRTQFKVHT